MFNIWNPSCGCCPERNIFSLKKFNSSGLMWRYPVSTNITNPPGYGLTWTGSDLYMATTISTRPLIKFEDGFRKPSYITVSGTPTLFVGAGGVGRGIIGGRAVVTSDTGPTLKLFDFNGNLLASNYVGVIYNANQHWYNSNYMWSQQYGSQFAKAWDADGNLVCNYDTGDPFTRMIHFAHGILWIQDGPAIDVATGTTLDSTFDTSTGGIVTLWTAIEPNIIARMGQSISTYDIDGTLRGTIPYIFGAYLGGWGDGGSGNQNKFGTYYDGEFFGMCYEIIGVTPRLAGMGWYDDSCNEIKFIDLRGLQSDWQNPWSTRLPTTIRDTVNGKRYVIGYDIVANRPGVTVFDENRNFMYSHEYIEEDNWQTNNQYLTSFQHVEINDNDEAYMCSVRFNFS